MSVKKVDCHVRPFVPPETSLTQTTTLKSQVEVNCWETVFNRTYPMRHSTFTTLFMKHSTRKLLLAWMSPSRKYLVPARVAIETITKRLAITDMQHCVRIDRNTQRSSVYDFLVRRMLTNEQKVGHWMRLGWQGRIGRFVGRPFRIWDGKIMLFQQLFNGTILSDLR